jgi:hypothetical protein
MSTAASQNKIQIRLVVAIILSLIIAWFTYRSNFHSSGKGSYDLNQDVYFLSLAVACLELATLCSTAVLLRVLFYLAALAPLLLFVLAVWVAGPVSGVTPPSPRDYLGIFPLLCYVALPIIDLKRSR